MEPGLLETYAMALDLGLLLVAVVDVSDVTAVETIINHSQVIV